MFPRLFLFSAIMNILGCFSKPNYYPNIHKTVVNTTPCSHFTKIIQNFSTSKYFSQTCTQHNLHTPNTNCVVKKNPPKLITISPGGLQGFYMMGVVSYIKEHYDLSDYVFSGASAGSWNAILFSYKGNLKKIIHKITNQKPKIGKKETIYEFELWLKQYILDNSKNSDFELHRVFIGVTTFLPFFRNDRIAISKLPYQGSSLAEEFRSDIPFLADSGGIFTKTCIFSNFVNLEDALNCCISSSHIPFVTGGFIRKYKDIYTFDGGFSKYPYYSGIVPTLHISPSIWNAKKTDSLFNIEDYTTLLYKEKYDFKQLFEEGYQDTKKNRKILETIFHSKNIKQ